jgi:hypothetical protein
VGAGRENGGGFSTGAHAAKIRLRPRRAAVLTGGDRCWRPLFREHGHCLVTGSVVGGVGPVTGMPS